MKKLKKTIKKIDNRIIFGGLFALVGFALIFAAKAATPTAFFEAENATKTGNASVVSDAAASGGSALKFNAAVSGVGRYQVQGRFLYDPCGQKVTIRGIENFFAADSWLSPTGEFLVEWEKTGANTARTLFAYPPDENFLPLTVPQMESLIQKTLANKMIPDIAIAGGKDYHVYLQSDIKTMLMKYQNKIILHAQGEGDFDDENLWVTKSKETISQLRAAGYTMPLYIMADYGGRRLVTILHKGQEVFESDPLRNVIFGWQAYWGQNGTFYQNQNGMSFDQAFTAVKNYPYPIQVGLLYKPDAWLNQDTVDYKLGMRRSQEYDIGWLWWDWRLGQEDGGLTHDPYRYGDWTLPFGPEVAVTDPNSIKNTSVRTNFINTGACQ